MNHLRVLPKIICFGIIIFFFAFPIGAQDTLPAPIRDYWPTDGWKESTPEQQGMDSQILIKMKPYIEKEFPTIRSVLIVRHGYLVYEQYFQYYNRDYKQSVMSVTKSISSALVGIALKEGYLKSLDQKLVDFFPEYITPEVDPRIRQITLKHLLTMSSGFKEEDLKWKTTQEKIRQKLIHEPGEIFAYDNYAPDFLTSLLIKTTNMGTFDFAKKYLFSPLGISEVTWETLTFPPFDKEPYCPAGWGVSLTSRDMAKFGYLYLNKGIWNGRQIVPSDFIRESTQKQIKTDWYDWHCPPSFSDYGYLWWVPKMERYPVYAAAGHGGQFMLIFSNLDMVTVITASGNGTNNESLNIIDKFIIPAILK